MAKTIGYVVLWLVGSAAAVAVAWTGVSVVDDEIAASPDGAEVVAGDRGPGPSSSELTSSSTSMSTSSSSSTPTSERDGASSTTTGSSSTATSRSMATTVRSATTAGGGPGATTPTTAPAGSRTTPTSGTTATPSSVATETRTFQLVGGTTAISFSPEGTTVLWATPNPGYEVRIEPESPGVKVEFRSESHESRLDAWWSGGPRHDIREEST